MARPSKHDGSIYPRRMARSCGWSIETGAESASGNQRITEDWQEAQRKLRERLQARDDKILDVVRKGEQLQFCGLGGLFSGELLQATDPRRKDPRSQRARGRASQGGIWSSDRLARLLRTISSFIFDGGCRREFRSGPAAGVIQRDRLKPSDSPSGTAGASPYAERRRPQEAAPGEPVRRSGVSRQGEGAVSASLYGVVGAAADRVPGARVLAEHHPDHH